MMGDIDRARRITEAAIATGLPVWVGFTCSRQADGEIIGFDMENIPRSFIESELGPESPPFEAVVSGLIDLDIQVAGVMHSTIANTTPGLEMLYQHWCGPVMAYPETSAFDPVDKSVLSSTSPEEFAEHCRSWVENGIQIIGGCCGTTIEHIRAMVEQLPTRPGKPIRH